jgi:hypothetical protein
MYSEPQTTKALSALTAGAAAATLPRVAFGTNNGAFLSADGMTKLSISHQYGARTRRVVRLDYKQVVADPLIAGVSSVQSASTYLVIDHPPTLLTVATLKGLVENLVTWLGESSSANTVKLLGGES